MFYRCSTLEAFKLENLESEGLKVDLKQAAAVSIHRAALKLCRLCLYLQRRHTLLVVIDGFLLRDI